MFNNTVKVFNSSTDAGLSLALIDGPTNRRTLRSSADGNALFSVAHQESNENPGFVTRRTNIRLTTLINVAETEKHAKVYAQFTMSVPHGIELDALVVQALVAQLVNFLSVPDKTAAGTVPVVYTGLTAIPRLIGQES